MLHDCALVPSSTLNIVVCSYINCFCLKCPQQTSFAAFCSIPTEQTVPVRVQLRCCSCPNRLHLQSAYHLNSGRKQDSRKNEVKPSVTDIIVTIRVSGRCDWSDPDLAGRCVSDEGQETAMVSPNVRSNIASSKPHKPLVSGTHPPS